jgi:hypothetical protein
MSQSCKNFQNKKTVQFFIYNMGMREEEDFFYLTRLAKKVSFFPAALV